MFTLFDKNIFQSSKLIRACNITFIFTPPLAFRNRREVFPITKFTEMMMSKLLSCSRGRDGVICLYTMGVGSHGEELWGGVRVVVFASHHAIFCFM